MKVFDFEKIRDRIKVDSKTDCWRWIGTVSKAGYGQIRINYKLHYLHRLMCKDLQPDQVVLHLCGSRNCLNPSHLKAGTQAENFEHAAINHHKGDDGVHWEASRNVWKVRVGTPRKQLYSGPSYEDALAARQQWERSLADKYVIEKA